MLLAVDIGNTSVSFALFDPSRNGDPLVVSSKLSVRKNCSADEYTVLIKQILDLKTDCNYSIDCSAVSSVVPSVTNAVVTAAGTLSNADPFIIGPGTKTGFKIAINDPACLGSDIVSNAAAALEICDAPLVIFDAGTANTITVIDNSRTITGTIILPGVRISAAALSENAELLDSIFLSDNDVPLIGKTTEQSIGSGLVYGNALMIDGFIRNIRESIISKDSDKKLGLVATGGFAELITDNCRNKFIVDDVLTLRGIASLYFKNKKNL